MGPPGSRHFESHSGHLSAGRSWDFPGGRGCPGPAVSPQSPPPPWRGGIRAAVPGLSPSSSLGEPPPSETFSRSGMPRPRCPSNSVQAPKIRREEEKTGKLASSFPAPGVRPPLQQPLLGWRREKNKDFHRCSGGRARWGGMQRTLTFPAEILPSQPAQGSAGPSWGFSRGFLRTTSFSSGWNVWEGKASIWDSRLGHLPGTLSGLPP